MNNIPGEPGTPVELPADFARIKANFQQVLRRKLGMQKLEWLYAIPFEGVVPANGGLTQEVQVRSDAHFECHFITGDFTTLNAGGADDDVNHMTVRISDASNDLRLTESPLPLNLFLSPGRTAAIGVAGNPTGTLFYPFPFEHIFAASGGILLEFGNAGATNNTVNLLFWGKKLRAVE